MSWGATSVVDPARAGVAPRPGCHPTPPFHCAFLTCSTGGGLWVLEPSAKLYAELLDFLAKPVPGSVTKENPNGEGFRWGDM